MTTVHDYLKTHGDAGWDSFPSYLDVVVPRVLDLLAARGLKITFFIVGQDATLPANQTALRSIADALDALRAFGKQARGEADDQHDERDFDRDRHDSNERAQRTVQQVARDEFAHHGYYHENPTKIERETERRLMELALDTFDRQLDMRPVGYRSWAVQPTPSAFAIGSRC